MTDFLVRLRGDHLAPDYQNGDILAVRATNETEPGKLAVVLIAGLPDARVRYYQPEEGHRVIGLVTAMHRVIREVQS